MKVTVQYLESLKTNTHQCTALIGPINGKWRRCKKRNGQGNSKAKGNGYRCTLHLKGGHEETLIARGWADGEKKKSGNRSKKHVNKSKKHVNKQKKHVDNKKKPVNKQKKPNNKPVNKSKKTSSCM